MTTLERMLSKGEVTTPTLRQVYYTTKGREGWRMIFTQNIITKAPSGGNSLVRMSQAINGWITVTAIMSTNEKFLQSVGIPTDVNTFYISKNGSGTAINANIPGEFNIEDKIVTANSIYGVQDTFILNIESFIANPFLAEHQPVINPAKNQAVQVLGMDGKTHPYYRHTELRLRSETPYDNQFISDLVNKYESDVVYHATPSVITSIMKYDIENGTDFIGQMAENPYLEIPNLNANVRVNGTAKISAVVNEMLM